MQNLDRDNVVAYFNFLATRSKIIKTFIVGDGKNLRRLVSDAQSATIEYPFLALDILEAPFKNGFKNYTIELFIGIGIEKDREIQDDILNLLSRHVSSLQKIVEKGIGKPQGLRCSIDSSVEDSESYTVDNVIGYLLKASASHEILCDFSQDFDLSLLDSTLAKFSWSISAGIVTIVNESVGMASVKFLLQEHKVSQIRPKEITNTFPQPKTSYTVTLQALGIDGKEYKAKHYWHYNDSRTAGQSHIFTPSINILT